MSSVANYCMTLQLPTKVGVCKVINVDKIDFFKNEFLDFLERRYHSLFDKNDLYLKKDCSIQEILKNSYRNLDLSIELFLKAKEAGDVLTMAAALIRVRIFMGEISGVFGRAVGDIDLFIRISDDVVFPEDYKIPGHYKYPQV